jgi:protein tyrosine phosphatase (PTP) superfamily phosphohydrolase (DUF442 family)
MNGRLALSLGLALSLAFAIPACSTPAAAPSPTPRAPSGRTPEEIAGLGEASGIHNFSEVATGLFRGAQPAGEASFEMLAGLGVKTILSVDGARPDVEAAARHGIRYVHVPIEYSGITRDQQVAIAAVAREADGNLFIHCHHGKHRGVAACDIAWRARDGASAEAALADMRKGGADPGYVGLYRDVAAFVPLTAEEEGRVHLRDLPSAARVPDLVESMVVIDNCFSRMKEIRAAGWKAPPKMPDVDPAHEARILAEHFREMVRLKEVAAKPADFRGWAGDAETAAWAAEASIRAGDGESAAKAPPPRRPSTA